MLSLFKVPMNDKIEDFVIPVLKSGYITQGKKVEEFEHMLQEYFNYPYIVTLNSCTSGLTLALRLCDNEFTSDGYEVNALMDGLDIHHKPKIPIERRNQVITTALTCTATNWPILANDLDIVWADVDPQTCNINLNSVKDRLNERTRAIMVVHWGGYPVDLDYLSHILDEHEEVHGYRPYVIEDCAHALGSRYNNQYIGTHGNICVFSLQAIKHLTTGDGGLIFLPNRKMYDRAKLLRWFGIDRERRSKPGDFRLEHDIPEWGYKYHMNDINASIGIGNLPLVKPNLERIQQVVNRYEEELSNLPNVKLIERARNVDPSYWIYTIKVSDKSHFIEYMKYKNIMASQVHNRNDNHPCVAGFRRSLPLLDELEKYIVAIPAGWWLTDDDVNHVISSIREWSIKAPPFETKIERINKNHYSCGFLELLSQRNDYDYSMSYSDYCDIVKRIERQNADVFVIMIGCTVVATAKALYETKFGDSVCHIEDVVVHSKYRKMGLGKMIVTHIIDKSDWCYKITLNAREELDDFYQSCGLKLKDKQYVKYNHQ